MKKQFRDSAGMAQMNFAKQFGQGAKNAFKNYQAGKDIDPIVPINDKTKPKLMDENAFDGDFQAAQARVLNVGNFTGKLGGDASGAGGTFGDGGNFLTGMADKFGLGQD